MHAEIVEVVKYFDRNICDMYLVVLDELSKIHRDVVNDDRFNVMNVNHELDTYCFLIEICREIYIMQIIFEDKIIRF